ncbi:MAG: glycosyltransferase family 4 protein [Planctomycetota bacterium]
MQDTPEDTPPTAAADRRLGFLCAGDPTRVDTYSGIHHAMLRHLEAEHGGPMPLIGHAAVRVRPWRRRVDRVRRRLRLPVARERYNAAAHLRLIRDDLRRHGTRVVYAPIATGLVARFDGDARVITYSDSTPRLLRGYYATHGGPDDAAAFHQSEEVERRALRRADAAVYASGWAAASAVEHYDADPAKVHVVPFGANIAGDGLPPETIAGRGLDGPLRLLYIGKYWQRKGGDIAVEALTHLRETGVDAVLHIVGTAPPRALPEGVVYEGFFDKAKAAGRAAFDDLLSRCHLFVLPTRAECFGVALVEASAYGLPPVSTDTGGIPAIVEPGVTGELLPLEAGPAAWAERIAALWADRPRYRAMSLAARKKYETRLNWTVWARDILRIADALDA